MGIQLVHASCWLHRWRGTLSRLSNLLVNTPIKAGRKQRTFIRFKRHFYHRGLFNAAIALQRKFLQLNPYWIERVAQQKLRYEIQFLAFYVAARDIKNLFRQSSELPNNYVVKSVAQQEVFPR